MWLGLGTQNRADPPKGLRADALQGLFELAVSWALLWGIPLYIWWAIVGLLDPVFLHYHSGLLWLLSAAIVAAGVVAFFTVCRKVGWEPMQALARCVHEFAFVLALGVGLFCGWSLRSEFVPDVDRANAERAALRIPLMLSARSTRS